MTLHAIPQLRLSISMNRISLNRLRPAIPLVQLAPLVLQEQA